MEDSRIVELYFQRDEAAIRETACKYEGYLTAIAYNILRDVQDCQESVNDTYLAAWNSMPPHRPARLSSYLGRITRHFSIDIYRKKHAEKRAGDETALSLEELSECIPGRSSPEKEAEARALAGAISAYLRTLPEEKRNVFVYRYYFLDSLAAIQQRTGYTGPKVKNMLHRTRLGLKKYLEKEGLV